MACYYLVISSTHLSNGHFRSIKGVFRGPLRKTGTTLPGYTEKGKSIANTLEDLKANFYCELCDKQYHKHQEFDNHINSYDHAHKQRLKELKQREFARNVASKSWKDEKKQEKALKRLHQLAELRKQTNCGADEGPIFKAPRLKGPQEDIGSNRDEKTASSRCVVMCSRDAITSNVEEFKQDILNDREVMKNSSCCYTGSQTQQPPSNSSSVNSRAGVSFCFSKKVLVKLDSSASVFNESTEEANECSQFFHHKEKQMSASFRHYAHVSETAAENSSSSQQDEKGTSLADSAAENAEKFKDDKASQENTKEQSEIAQSNITAEMQSPDTTCTDQPSPKEVNVTSETEITSKAPTEVLCQAESSEQEACSNKHTVADAILLEHLSNLLSQKHGEAEEGCNEGNSTASNDVAQSSIECPTHSLGESLNNNTQAKALSFLSVLSKDGNTILQWPTELVLFTKTQPSISYACNPLYFDFKCSQKNKTGTSKERVTRNNDQSDGCRNDCNSRSSGTNAEKGTGNENNDWTPKRQRVHLKDRSEKQMEFSENVEVATEFTHKAKFSHLQDYRPQMSNDFSHPHKFSVRQSHHSRNRRRHSDYSSTSKNMPSKGELKRKRFVHEDQSDFKNKWNNLDKSKKRKQRSRYESDFSWESSDGNKDSDSDTSSSVSAKSYFSRMSSSSSSMSSNSTSRHEGIVGRTSTYLAAAERGSYMDRKHNSDMSSESDCNSEVGDQLRCRCKYEKHKTSSETSRRGSVEHHICSKHGKCRNRSRKTVGDLETEPRANRSHSAQDINNESSNTVDSRTNISSASPKETIPPSHFLKSPHNMESDNSDINDCLYKCYFPDIPLPMDCMNSTSENTVQHTIGEKTIISEFLVEDDQSTKETVDNNTDLGIGLNNHAHNAFDIRLPPADTSNIVLPLHDTIKNDTNNGTDPVLENLVDHTEYKGSPSYNVTLTANTDNSPLDEVNPMETEWRMDIPVDEPQGQLISQVQTFMQNPDPVHLNFSCGLPSVRHAGGTGSPNTKEEQKRLGPPDIPMRLGPVEGNFKCCYESTMQDYRTIDHNRRFHHKTSPPSLAQQPITFSPEEVDKYKVLQFQAQQHMQKQLLTKHHFKALPANGTPAFSNAQTVQPVSVQPHPSITTIHHAFMQRYAVTASMHSHVSHFPVPHLNPLPQSQFTPMHLSSLPPTIIPTHPQLIAGHPLAHPLHLVSSAAIHPGHLTIQAIPHATLIPTLFTPHPNTGMHASLQLHPFIHPLFPGQEFHHNSGPSYPH
ncbi:PREDICTED: zinc finger protein 804B [Nanorana parkeri]|uniref:zinc finger protein 804B n=1 Tax=Nanorana parkeri TaxID=125878 RepID=UPI00085427FD|nr:PREDICTED: zinc finger protein 804B [Nanorana parkeri]